MKKNNIFSYIIPVFIFTLFIFFGSIPNKTEALTLSPARMELKGDPGTTVTKNITLINDTKDTATYYTSYANFEAQGETGSPSFVEPKGDLGTWMSTDKTITLKPQEIKTIPLTISIPKDAYAGGHFAVAFFGSQPSNNGGQVSVGAKTGVLVLLTVNGDILEAGGLASFNVYKTGKDNKLISKRFFTTLPVTFQYRWKNDGNDRVKPEGKISLRSLYFIPVGHIDANEVSGNILPHSSRLFTIDWIKHARDIKEGADIKSNSIIKSYFNEVGYQWKNFAVGPYLAHLDLVSGINKVHSTKNVILFVFPWQLLIVIFIILAILLVLLKTILKSYKNKIIKQARLSMNTQNDASNEQ